MTVELQPAFRTAMRRLASSVAIVALHDQVLRGMTATSLVSVTMDPPTLLICVNRSASIHAHLRVAREMSVNLLSVAQASIADAFAGKVSPDERFRHGEWQDCDGIPYLVGAQANVLCRIASLTVVGSHTMILAEVHRVSVSDSLSPLLYCDGGYRAIAQVPANS